MQADDLGQSGCLLIQMHDGMLQICLVLYHLKFHSFSFSESIITTPYKDGFTPAIEGFAFLQCMNFFHKELQSYPPSHQGRHVHFSYRTMQGGNSRLVLLELVVKVLLYCRFVLSSQA